MNTPSIVVCVAVALGGSAALAAGGQNAHGNPVGDPPDETYQTPYASQGDGRLLVYCAEDELLVITPVDTGAAEATCQPAE